MSLFNELFKMTSEAIVSGKTIINDAKKEHNKPKDSKSKDTNKLITNIMTIFTKSKQIITDAIKEHK